MAGTPKLARYRDIRTLGSGGMGTVALAEDTVLGRQVALKRVTGSAGDQGLLRLRREALVGASVSHPNLVSIYDVDTSEEGDLVIVMEYVEGETLRDLLTRKGRLEPAELLSILEGAAAGLDAIHKEGIVHRDVKPANVLLSTDGTAKVADLGIASVVDQTRITTSGAVLGSLSYMAPEQLKDAPATAAIDVYALAAVAYEALSGQKARRETNPVALAYAVSTQPPPDLRDAWPEAPAQAAELLMRAMAKEPRDRPPSASEFVARLRATLAPEKTAPLRPDRGERAPGAGAGAVAGAGAAAAGAAAAKDADAASNPTRAPRRLTPQRATPPRRPTTSPRRPTPQRSTRGDAAPAAAATAPPEAATRPPSTEPPRAAEGSASGGPRRGQPAARRRESRRALIPALLALALVAVVLAVVLSAGGSSPQKNADRSSGGSQHGSATAKSRSSTTTAGASSSSTAPASLVSPTAHTPAAAVQSFYRLAAAHQYGGAWALADPAFQSQLGGYGSFQSTFSGDRSITFGSTRIVNQSGHAATVAIRTTSVRVNGTQSCTGTVDLITGASSSQWLLHHIQVACTPG